MKPAVFIDAYLSSPDREEIFQRNVQNFIDAGYDLFIISNKMRVFDKLDNVKYFEYDSRNRLLTDRNSYLASSDSDYLCYSKNYDLFLNNGEIATHELSICSPVYNPTNLSVLYNTRRICDIAKEFGYTNILRVEYDCIFENYDFENNLLKGYNTEDWNNYGLAAKGCFSVYTNFIYLNIDYVINNIPLIKTEDQYKTFMLKNFGDLKYLTFETIMAKMLNKIKILSDDESIKYLTPNIDSFTSDQGYRRYMFYSDKLLVANVNNNTKLFVDNQYDHSVEIKVNYDNQILSHVLCPSCFRVFDIEPNKKLSVSHKDKNMIVDTTKSIGTFTKV